LPSREENIADFLLGVSIGTLADYFEGLENVPGELLDRSYQANMGYAKVITEMFEHDLQDPLDELDVSHEKLIAAAVGGHLLLGAVPGEAGRQANLKDVGHHD
jgi:hypothetical protein